MNLLRPPISLDDVVVGARFLWNVPPMFRHPITRDEARAALRRRLEHRQTHFLGCVRELIYAYPASPYRRLLALAGCEYGDVEKLVRQEGIEPALAELFRRGVYLTLDELKGRQPVVRGSATFKVDPSLVANPHAQVHLAAQSSGSGGARSRVGIDLRSIRHDAGDIALFHEAHGERGWRTAIWGVPGGWSIIRFLELAVFGVAPERWFSQVDPRRGELHARYPLSVRALRWGARLGGVRLPRPEHVALDDPLPIARWIGAVLRAGQIPHLMAFASSAMRLCRAAAAHGLDVRGARFTISGEPITEARAAAIREVGGYILARCGTTETGAIGVGCLTAEADDELHLLTDLHAVIQPGAAGAQAGLPAGALLLTSVRPMPRTILLNASLGDQATLTRRACGCPLERLGWTTHVHTLRSHAKVTAGGMTFSDAEVVRVLEHDLPARFGGSATDYQLMEDESPDGSPRLRLLVHPALGPLDADAVADAFLEAIGAGTESQRVMGLAWRQAGFVRVERRAPALTSSGKIRHLHPTKPAC